MWYYHGENVRELTVLQFEWSLKTASSAEVDAVYKLAKTRLPAAIEARLASFPSTIVEVHGKDVHKQPGAKPRAETRRSGVSPRGQ